MKRNLMTLSVGKRRYNFTLEDMAILKVIIMLGIAAGYFLPGHLAAPITVATNLIWLWRV